MRLGKTQFTENPEAYLLFANQLASGTPGGAATSGAWRTCPINTEVVDTHNLGSLTNNEITLQSGTYRARASQALAICDSGQIRIWNVSDSVVVPNQVSPNVWTSATTSVGYWAEAIARFTITSAKVLRLEYRVGTTRATNGLGVASNWGTETYCLLEFWREPI